jgi:hypothetical protein
MSTPAPTEIGGHSRSRDALQGSSGPAQRQMSGARYEPSESDRNGVR